MAMTRLLLTLLALMTGLVAQVSPAQARSAVAGGAEIGAIAAWGGERMAQPSRSADYMHLGQESRPLHRIVPLKRAPVGKAPAVLIGIDRARQ